MYNIFITKTKKFKKKTGGKICRPSGSPART